MISNSPSRPLAALGLSSGAALAAGEEAHVADYAFPFEGPFGTYDQMQLQRGLQVYTEVCSACHGLKYVPFRTLGDEGGPGLPEDQVRAYAAALRGLRTPSSRTSARPRRPTTSRCRSSMNAPDLSLMAKARAGFHGPYGIGLNQLFNGIGRPGIHRLDPHRLHRRGEGGGGRRSSTRTRLPRRLDRDAAAALRRRRGVRRRRPTDIESEAKDVAAFLMWTAEPKIGARKQAGFVGVLMLAILAVLLYLTNKRIWAPVKRRHRRRTHRPSDAGAASHARDRPRSAAGGSVSTAPASAGAMRASVVDRHDANPRSAARPRGRG